MTVGTSASYESLTVEVLDQVSPGARSQAKTWPTYEGRSTSCGSSASAWDSLSCDSSSDDERTGSQPEQIFVTNAVHNRLEDMNKASCAVNSVQSRLDLLNTEREKCEEIWAVRSARFARLLGSQSLTRARYIVERERATKLAQKQVHTSSCEYWEAMQSASVSGKLETLRRAHAERVAKFEAARLDLMEAESTITGSAVREIALNYLDEEGCHKQRLMEMEIAVSEVGRELSEAKRRYAEALGSLETISEAIHDGRICRTRTA